MPVSLPSYAGYTSIGRSRGDVLTSPKRRLNQSHDGTYMPCRSQACGFHFGFGFRRVFAESLATRVRRQHGPAWGSRRGAAAVTILRYLTPGPYSLVLQGQVTLADRVRGRVARLIHASFAPDRLFRLVIPA